MLKAHSRSTFVSAIHLSTAGSSFLSLSFVTLTGLQDQDFFMCIKFAKDDVDVDKQAELVEMLK